jgi:double-stranded uracil-DNA glycosylase
MTHDQGHRITMEWMGQRIETLRDLLSPEVRVVCVGINPSPVSVAQGHYFQGPLGKRFFNRLRVAGLLPPDSTGWDDDAAFQRGIGFTDIVKRPTPRAGDVSREEFEYGRTDLEHRLATVAPELIVFTFKRTAEVVFGTFLGCGMRGETWLGARVFVMPSPYASSADADPVLAELTAFVATDLVARR